MTTERPSYLWSVVCAWALTIAVGALTVAGVLAMFMRLGPDGDAALRTLCVISFAAVAGLALANANNAASAAMHAMSRGTQWKQWHHPTLIPALICAAGFCLSSVIGVHLGWEIMTRGSTHAEMCRKCLDQSLVRCTIHGTRTQENGEGSVVSLFNQRPLGTPRFRVNSDAHASIVLCGNQRMESA